MGAESRATIRCVAPAHSQGEQGLKDTIPAMMQMRACAYRRCTFGGGGGDLRRVERRRAMAPAVELGRAATMASVRAAGDDVARPLSDPSGLLCLPGKDWVACNGMFVELVLGMAEVDSWKELTESFLKPCGTPAGSKGSPLPGGRTVTWSEEAFKRIFRPR